MVSIDYTQAVQRLVIRQPRLLLLGTLLNQSAYQIKPVSSEWNYVLLECGPKPNLMVALPNIGGALCATPQSLADAHY